MDKKKDAGSLLTNSLIFIENYEEKIIISYDHIVTILDDIYQRSLKPIIDTTKFDIVIKFKIHILGLADNELVTNGYLEYAKETARHPNVTFIAEPEIFQYGAAPWLPILKL